MSAHADNLNGFFLRRLFQAVNRFPDIPVRISDIVLVKREKAVDGQGDRRLKQFLSLSKRYTVLMFSERKRKITPPNARSLLLPMKPEEQTV